MLRNLFTTKYALSLLALAIGLPFFTSCKGNRTESGLQYASFAYSPLVLGIGRHADPLDPRAFRIYASSTRFQDLSGVFFCFDNLIACQNTASPKTVLAEEVLINNQRIFVSKKYIQLSDQLAFYVIARSASQSQAISMQVKINSAYGGGQIPNNNNGGIVFPNGGGLPNNNLNNMSQCIEAPDQFVCDVELAIWKFTNEFRVQNGRSELPYHPKASYVARLWSQEQARTGRISHEWYQNGKLKSLYQQKFGESVFLSAENVAQNNVRRGDANATAKSMVNQWINSSGHRANMLGGHTHLGVGVAIKGSQFYGTHSFVRDR